MCTLSPWDDAFAAAVQLPRCFCHCVLLSFACFSTLAWHHKAVMLYLKTEKKVVRIFVRLSQTRKLRVLPVKDRSQISRVLTLCTVTPQKKTIVTIIKMNLSLLFTKIVLFLPSTSFLDLWISPMRSSYFCFISLMISPGSWTISSGCSAMLHQNWACTARHALLLEVFRTFCAK